VAIVTAQVRTEADPCNASGANSTESRQNVHITVKICASYQNHD
jgi:hypothetical protein